MTYETILRSTFSISSDAIVSGSDVSRRIDRMLESGYRRIQTLFRGLYPYLHPVEHRKSRRNVQQVRDYFTRLIEERLRNGSKSSETDILDVILRVCQEERDNMDTEEVGMFVFVLQLFAMFYCAHCPHNACSDL